MKAFFSLVLLGAAIALVHATATKETSDKVRAAVKKCTQEHNLDPAVVEEFVKLRKLPEKEEGKCAVLCYFKEMGYVTDGKFNDEKVQESNKSKWSDAAVAEKANGVYQTCVKDLNLAGVTLDCENSVKMLGCLKTEGVKQSVPFPELHKEE